MGETGGELFFIVGHHDEGLALELAEGVDDVLHYLAVLAVESVKRLVENEQLWVLDAALRWRA